MPVEHIHVTVKAKVTPGFKIRFWLGRQLLFLLARIWTAKYTLTFHKLVYNEISLSNEDWAQEE